MHQLGIRGCTIIGFRTNMRGVQMTTVSFKIVSGTEIEYADKPPAYK